MIHAVSSFFRDVSVGTRLFLLMGWGGLAIAAGAAVFAVADLRTGTALERHDAFIRILDLSQEAETGLAQLRAGETAFLLRGDRDSAETYAKRSARLLAVLKTLGDIPETTPIRQAIDTLRDGVAEHVNEFRKIADLEGDGPPAKLAKLRAAAEAATTAIEKALVEPGRDALAARMLVLERYARRVLAGEPQAAVEMVRVRNEGFDRALAQAALGEAETAHLAELMNAYFSAVLDEAAEHGRQQRAAARLDEILGYLRPSREALAGFRRETVAAIGETAEERDEIRTWMILAVAGTALAFILLGGLITRSISRPLRGLAFAGRQLSDGNREAFIPISTAGNEIGDLARALRAVRDMTAEAGTRLRARDERDKATLLRGQVVQKALLDEIESGVRNAVEAIAAAADELRRLASAAGCGAAEIGHHAGDINAASHETTANLRKLATVASTLHASIVETQHGLTANGPAEEADGADGVDTRIAELGRLALRTRLMALNSVIGAAHAHNGRGPAIEEIAAEIGILTRRIAEESAVLAPQEAAKAASRAPLDELVQSVRGHGTATRDILRNAEGAVAAALSLTNAISRITRTAGETGQVATAMQRTADRAAQHSAKLKDDVDAILARLRR